MSRTANGTHDGPRTVPVNEVGNEFDVVERPVTLSAMEAQTRGEIDIQISTAKRFPRSIRTFRDTALEAATLDEDTAASCMYALPRGGKTIEGPTARLAEICASAWGHMRVEARVVSEDDRFLTAKAVAWDLQNNVAIAIEVRRRVTDNRGRTFNDDMIGVTANAAVSIAVRNAVFKVIPKAFWEGVYRAARKTAVGDAKTLVARRTEMIAYFAKMGVQPDRVFALLEVKGEEDITLEHMATLRGLATAIKDGDTTVDEAFATPTANGAAAPTPGRPRTEAVAEALKAKMGGPGGPMSTAAQVNAAAADIGGSIIAQATRPPAEQVQAAVAGLDAAFKNNPATAPRPTASQASLDAVDQDADPVTATQSPRATAARQQAAARREATTPAPRQPSPRDDPDADLDIG